MMTEMDVANEVDRRLALDPEFKAKVERVVGVMSEVVYRRANLRATEQDRRWVRMSAAITLVLEEMA